jgi:actin-related protein
MSFFIIMSVSHLFDVLHSHIHTKAGYADNNGRSQVSVIPCLTGNTIPNVDIKTRYHSEGVLFGEDISNNTESLSSLTQPIQHGLITDWDAMEDLWHYSIHYELRAASEEHPFLFSEGLLSPADPTSPSSPTKSIHGHRYVMNELRHQREKIFELMFERFVVPALSLQHTSSLSLFANGKTTGCVVELGESISQVIPIVGGNHILQGSITECAVTGGDLTNYYIDVLKLQTESVESIPSIPHVPSTLKQYEAIRQIKEHSVFVALDYESERKQQQSLSTHSKTYYLPDGAYFDMGTERFQCGEALFRPALVKKDSAIGIHEGIFNAITQCDSAMRSNMFQNITLSGGNTMLPGLVRRLEKELSTLAPRQGRISVQAPKDRKFSVWIGGSILASMPSFEEMAVLRNEWDEYGVSIIGMKCP